MEGSTIAPLRQENTSGMGTPFHSPVALRCEASDVRLLPLPHCRFRRQWSLRISLSPIKTRFAVLASVYGLISLPDDTCRRHSMTADVRVIGIIHHSPRLNIRFWQHKSIRKINAPSATETLKGRFRCGCVQRRRTSHRTVAANGSPFAKGEFG